MIIISDKTFEGKTDKAGVPYTKHLLFVAHNLYKGKTATIKEESNICN